MPASRNKVYLLGTLTQNPVSKPVGQTTLTTIEIETQRNYTTKGQEKEELALVQVEFFGKTAEAIMKYCKAGSLVDVEARLKLDFWEYNGKTMTKLKCVGEVIQFLDGAPRESQPQPARPPTAGVPTGSSQPQRTAAPQPSGLANPPAAEEDDSIPF